MRCAQQELSAALVGPQVDLALAVARLDVGDAAATCRRSCAGPRPAAPTAATFTESSPALGPHHLAPGPDPVAEVELVNPSKSSVTFARANSCTEPDESRSSAKASLPWGRDEHHPAGHRHPSPDSSPGAERRPAPRPPRPRVWVRSKRYGTRPGRRRRTPGSPSSVDVALEDDPQAVQGEPGLDVLDGVANGGRSASVSPPVATTVEGPSSSMKRRHIPSTWGGEPVEGARLDRLDGGAPDRRSAARPARPGAAPRRAGRAPRG